MFFNLPFEGIKELTPGPQTMMPPPPMNMNMPPPSKCLESSRTDSRIYKNIDSVFSDAMMPPNLMNVPPQMVPPPQHNMNLNMPMPSTYFSNIDENKYAYILFRQTR